MYFNNSERITAYSLIIGEKKKKMRYFCSDWIGTRQMQLIFKFFDD